MDLQQKLYTICKNICEENNCILVEMLLKGGRRDTIVQVYADTKEGITLGQCEDLNRKIQDELDMDEKFTRYYRLDVSSPGLDRPLIHDFQFEKYLGKELVFKIESENKAVKKTARLKSFDPSVFELESEDTVEKIDRQDVSQVKVKIRW